MNAINYIIAESVLASLERLRESKQNSSDSPDYTIRLCEAIVASQAGYEDRMEWTCVQ